MVLTEFKNIKRQPSAPCPVVFAFIVAVHILVALNSSKLTTKTQFLYFCKIKNTKKNKNVEMRPKAQLLAAARLTSTPGVDVQLRQGQGKGQLTALGVGGTLQDVVHGVPASRPTGSDEVCVRGLDIRHRWGIIYTAAPAGVVTLVSALIQEAEGRAGVGTRPHRPINFNL